jgi:hypothetical protein
MAIKEGLAGLACLAFFFDAVFPQVSDGKCKENTVKHLQETCMISTPTRVSQTHEDGNFWVSFSCRFPASFLQVSDCSLPLETCRISAPKDCSIFKDL